MTTRQDFDKAPVEERLNYTERAVSMLVSELSNRSFRAAKSAREFRAQAAIDYKRGNIHLALQFDSSASRAEGIRDELDAVLARFRSWQALPSTPPDQLPFPA